LTPTPPSAYPIHIHDNVHDHFFSCRHFFCFVGLPLVTIPSISYFSPSWGDRTGEPLLLPSRNQVMGSLSSEGFPLRFHHDIHHDAIQKGSSPSLSLTLPLKYDEEGGNLIPSERIGHTYTHTTQVLRKADAQLHPECQKIWDPEILAGKVHRRQKLGCVKEKEKKKAIKKRATYHFQKSIRSRCSARR
jgi:hypothetical protein